MKKKITGIIAGLVLLGLLCSGAFAEITSFLIWLFTLQNASPNISVAGGIFVRILTFFVSYGLVGLIFNSLNWFNGKAMTLLYFVVSTLVGFGLSYIVWKIEENMLIIGVILGVVFAGIITCFISYILHSRRSKKENIEIVDNFIE